MGPRPETLKISEASQLAQLSLARPMLRGRASGERVGETVWGPMVVGARGLGGDPTPSRLPFQPPQFGPGVGQSQ